MNHRQICRFLHDASVVEWPEDFVDAAPTERAILLTNHDESTDPSWRQAALESEIWMRNILLRLEMATPPARVAPVPALEAMLKHAIEIGALAVVAHDAMREASESDMEFAGGMLQEIAQASERVFSLVGMSQDLLASAETLKD